MRNLRGINIIYKYVYKTTRCLVMASRKISNARRRGTFAIVPVAAVTANTIGQRGKVTSSITASSMTRERAVRLISLPVWVYAHRNNGRDSNH